MADKQRITGGNIIQSRAIKTREKLLKEALRIYAKNGYHDTTVDEIARNAGFSVGTAYRYFKDKKELLLAALEYAFSHIEELADISETDISRADIEQALISFEKIHMDYYDLHEELEGLRHTDEDVRRLYDHFTESALNDIYNKLPEEIRSRAHSLQDIRLAVGLMENHCHYCMHGNPDKEAIAYMRKKTIDLVRRIVNDFRMK
ncbi:MAG: TetR/AcrR family transcriptional regulator [Lachnospiraceae bacterium]|nr:TetR/AcrR family transcriptional regulator [Lachnospiraceae bacterium]